MISQHTGKTVNEGTPLIAPQQNGFFSRMGSGIASAAGYCWRGVKAVARVIENPAILALSAIGTGGVFYGAGDVITNIAGPSLWLLAAPIAGVVGTVIVRYRPRSETPLRAFKAIDNVFEHAAKMISRVGFHFLYFNRIANNITGGEPNTATVIVVPITAVTTAVLGHWLKESLKNNENPNTYLALLSAILVKPIDYGSALSPVFYVFGPENSGLLNSNVLMYTELSLTAVGIINETVINRLSKKIKFGVDWAFDLFSGTSRTAYVLSTIESLDALANNDNVSLPQLVGTSTTLILTELPFDWFVTSRRRLQEYKELTGAIPPTDEKPVGIDNVTWSLAEACQRRRAQPTLFALPDAVSSPEIREEETNDSVINITESVRRDSI